MSNTITSGYNVFVTRTTIESAKVNQNFATIKDRAPIWNAFSVSSADMVALGAVATGRIALFSITSSEVLDAVIIKHNTAFSGGAVSAAKVRVGLSTEDDYFTGDFDVFAAIGSNLAVNNLSPLFTATTVYLTASLTGGNLSALAAGGLTVYVRRSSIP
jgi:hypothetical protein